MQIKMIAHKKRSYCSESKMGLGETEWQMGQPYKKILNILTSLIEI